MSNTPADLIITNAHVMTMEPGAKPAEAIAVRGNRIAGVGTAAESRSPARGRNKDD